MVFRKRGVSAVVATVLIILITIGGVAIVAGFVIPFVRENLARGTECVGLQDYFQFEESFEIQNEEYKYNCFVNDGGTYYYGASVRAKGDESLAEKVNGFSLVFISPEGNSKSIKVIDGELNEEIKKIGTTGNEEYAIPGPGDVLTYVHQSGESYSSIEVHPIVESGRSCVASDIINLIRCSDNVVGAIKN